LGIKVSYASSLVYWRSGLWVERRGQDTIPPHASLTLGSACVIFPDYFEGLGIFFVSFSFLHPQLGTGEDDIASFEQFRLRPAVSQERRREQWRGHLRER
jgi:hypothetical protein